MKLTGVIFVLALLVLLLPKSTGHTQPSFADSCSTAENEAVVEGFFDSFVLGTSRTFIENNFDPNMEYTVVGTESNIFGVNREAVLTHTGFYEGIEGAIYFLVDLTATEREVKSFDVHEVFCSGDSCAAFGSFFFLSPTTTGGSGDTLETEWAAQINMRDCKIFIYQFFEDTYAVASGYRHKFSQDQQINWRRESGGAVRDISTGINGNDYIDKSGSSNQNFIFGYKGDDTLIGGLKDDTLYGGQGANMLTGNQGSDLFAIGHDQGINTITDFSQGEDFLGLTLGLPFAELSFTPSGDDLEIKHDGGLLATLTGGVGLILAGADVKAFPTPPATIEVGGGFFTKEDPFGDPPADPSLDQEANVAVVASFFDIFINGGGPEALVSDDAKVTVAGTESRLFGAERDAVLPHTGLYEGKEGVHNFFSILDSERELLSFEVEEIYSSGSSVAAFGTYTYRSPLDTGGSGDVLGTEWAARFSMVEGDNDGAPPLIYRSYIYEDTAAQVASFSHKFPDSPTVSWIREFAGRNQTYRTGTHGKDTIIGEGSPVNLRNRIFGYGGNDNLKGNKWNDFLYGGNGHDKLRGDKGHDDLYGGKGKDTLSGGDGDDNLYGNEDDDILMGGEGNDIFVLGSGQGSDTIRDYKDGEDRLGLLESLTFEDLVITQRRNNVEIKTADTDELLATLRGAKASDITATDFTKRSDSGAMINACRDLLGEEFEPFGFNDPDYPVCDHSLIDIPSVEGDVIPPPEEEDEGEEVDNDEDGVD